MQLDEEIKAANDNIDLEHANAEATYAKKTELDGYLPLSGGTLTGYLKMRELDGSELKHETFSLDLVQGYLDGKNAYMKFDVHPGDYSTNRTMIEIGNLIDSNTTADSSDVLGIYSDFFQARFNPISKSFAVCNRPNTSKDVMWSNITLAPRDDDEAYVEITSYLGDSKDPSNFNQATYKSTGITFRNKTASDLLHAAGGTVSIRDIINQVPAPDLSDYLTLERADAKYTSYKRMSADSGDTWEDTLVNAYIAAYRDTVSDSSTNGPYSILGGNQATVIQVNPSAGAYSAQLAIGFEKPQLAFRKLETGTSWGPWQKVLTWDNIDDKPTFATIATSGSYEDLENKPEFKTIGGESILGSGNFDIATESDIQALFN